MGTGPRSMEKKYVPTIISREVSISARNISCNFTKYGRTKGQHIQEGEKEISNKRAYKIEIYIYIVKLKAK
jgi:hypothetical protein